LPFSLPFSTPPVIFSLSVTISCPLLPFPTYSFFHAILFFSSPRTRGRYSAKIFLDKRHAYNSY
jgi:hypothetical protein